MPAAAQTGAITGVVVSTDNVPLGNASVHAARTDNAIARDVVTRPDGGFRVSGLGPGLYHMTIRKVGFRSAEVATVRVAESQVVTLRVTLTRAPRQLSTIQVVASPITIDASTPEISTRLDRTFTQQLPTARDASSLIALIPGARKDQLWGAAPGVSNDYQLDGVSMNHPGLGGDFLGLSVDWVEAVDVRGLGVGAENGNFQGGIINAITKTGSNDRSFTFRTNYESEGLTASNFNAEEVGQEQAGRREIGAEVLGPIARDRLFYFAGVQYVGRDLRSPDLTSTTVQNDFQSTREEHRDGRGIAKLTWLPAPGQRVDVLGGVSSYVTHHGGINGLDDPSALTEVRQPSAFYELTWNNSVNPASQLDARIAGYTSREDRTGELGDDVPGVQPFQIGRQPVFQNAAFDERRRPSSIGANLSWTSRFRLAAADHKLVLGGDASRGSWKASRTRNGGVTWRPYPMNITNFSPTDATTWLAVGSEWGGEMRIDSDVSSEALFVQDYASIGPRVTLTPGLRVSHWAGFVTPPCGRAPVLGGSCGESHEVVSAVGLDPRIGLSWDVTGRNDLAVKLHWGRYHQGMYSLFFDRAEGTYAYTNERDYYTAPPITDSHQTFTEEQRDAPGSGFGTYWNELIMNESGRVDHYRQPYVDQAVAGIEKSFGSSWKLEVTYTNRRNGDIVGLIDRNMATNYVVLHDVKVDHRFAPDIVLDPSGAPLVLPTVYISTGDLKAFLDQLNANDQFPTQLLGIPVDSIRAMTWNRDMVLTTVPQAWRHYNQVTTMVRTFHPRWRGEASVTLAQLKGNVAGATGYGTTGTEFSAGPFARPNEAINMTGTLPDALQMEGKLWLTYALRRTLTGGIVYTHTYGERVTPTFRMLPRYLYTWGTNPDVLQDGEMRSILGQTIFLERRGSRHYASRDIVDTHLEWRTPRKLRSLVLTFDVFNIFGSDALTEVNTNVGDGLKSDPTSTYGAPRLRVSPRTLRLGLRVDHLPGLEEPEYSRPTAAPTPPPTFAQSHDWAAVDAAMGRAGVTQANGVHRYSFGRGDMHVSVNGVAVATPMALGGWIAMKPHADGVMAMGDLVLADSEVSPVIARLQQGGVEQTAIHHHLLHESPRVLYVHVHADGDPVKIAETIRAAMALTGTPAPAPSQGTPAAFALDTAAVAQLLGFHGTVNGGVFQVSAPRAEKVMVGDFEVPANMGVATAINFQPTDAGRAAVTGDFVLTASEVNDVVRALRENGIEVTALHSHLIGESPTLYFMHFWATDQVMNLARGIRAALDKTNSKR